MNLKARFCLNWEFIGFDVCCLTGFRIHKLSNQDYCDLLSFIPKYGLYIYVILHCKSNLKVKIEVLMSQKIISILIYDSFVGSELLIPGLFFIFADADKCILVLKRRF